MSKDPAFLFYPGDYLGGTMGFNFEKHGAYLMLLIYQFNNGPFTQDEGIQIVGEKLFTFLRKKFTKKNDLFFNERLAKEMKKRKKFSDSRRENVNSRWNKEKNMKGNDTSVLQKNTHVIQNDECVLHMENRNRNKDIDSINTIVEYLNQKCKTNYKATTKKTQSLINVRLKEGFSIDDFKSVIEKKSKDWLGTDYERYLRPETLFGTKFESYLNFKPENVVKAYGNKNRIKNEYTQNNEIPEIKIN